MNRTINPGEIYRHFKDKLYQIITIAEHSETKDKYVVYQALYGEFKTYIRPYDMFISEVDRVKYPEVTQKYRFEKISDAPEEKKSMDQMSVEEKMMEFFDTEDLEARYRILLKMREEITDTMIDNMAVVMDVVIPDGDIAMRYDSLKRAIQTKQRYEQNYRLR